MKSLGACFLSKQRSLVDQIALTKSRSWQTFNCSILFANFQIISAVYLHESQAAPKPLGLIKGKIALAKTKFALVKTKLAIAKAPHLIATALVAKEVKAKAKIAAVKAKAAVRINLFFSSFPFKRIFFDHFNLWTKKLRKYYRPSQRRQL